MSNILFHKMIIYARGFLSLKKAKNLAKGVNSFRLRIQMIENNS